MQRARRYSYGLASVPKAALSVFTTAMFISNLALTTAGTVVFAISKYKPAIFRWLGVVTAAYSLWIGIVLIVGK